MWAVLAAAIWVCALATPQPLHLERDSFRRPQPLDWQKRDQAAPQPPQLMLRSPRSSSRQYDVPQIGESIYQKRTIEDHQISSSKSSEPGENTPGL